MALKASTDREGSTELGIRNTKLGYRVQRRIVTLYSFFTLHSSKENLNGI
jgi:hypothetical protein